MANIIATIYTFDKFCGGAPPKMMDYAKNLLHLGIVDQSTIAHEVVDTVHSAHIGGTFWCIGIKSVMDDYQ